MKPEVLPNCPFYQALTILCTIIKIDYFSNLNKRRCNDPFIMNKNREGLYDINI